MALLSGSLGAKIKWWPVRTKLPNCLDRGPRRSSTRSKRVFSMASVNSITIQIDDQLEGKKLSYWKSTRSIAPLCPTEERPVEENVGLFWKDKFKSSQMSAGVSMHFRALRSKPLLTTFDINFRWHMFLDFHNHLIVNTVHFQYINNLFPASNAF